METFKWHALMGHLAMDHEDENYNLEIVSLFANNNGNSCCQHRTCREHVATGDVLHLIKTIVTMLVKIQDKMITCTVLCISFKIIEKCQNQRDPRISTFAIAWKLSGYAHLDPSQTCEKPVPMPF